MIVIGAREIAAMKRLPHLRILWQRGSATGSPLAS
jgi:hypothetical protein